ncbi:MAG: branched-chain amino acid ABC transporter permease [Pseudomonadota bacterium]|nr:branched-chain amino acid ABC transporter permease [Pseudomonadota bacterium]
MRNTVNGVVLAVLGVFLAGAPWILDALGVNFWLDILTEILIWSLFAASVNLLFGYTGLLSFGQALFFGFGMYGVALGIAKLGLGFWPALGLGMMLSTSMAAITGALAVRLTWHYFAIITVVFSLIFYFVALSAKTLTGGDDGTPFSMPPMFAIGDTEISLSSFLTQYYFVLGAVALAFYLKYRLVRSPLGMALTAVRENDARAEMIGLNVYLLRLTSFIAAGALAGLSGCLFALFGRYASASYMFYHVSGEGVVWTLIGGAGTILGPMLGTALVVLVREELSNLWEHYPILVGLVVILTVAFAPRGLMGTWNDLLDRLDTRFGKATAVESKRRAKPVKARRKSGTSRKPAASGAGA